MDFHKLKIDAFSTYQLLGNIPDFNPPLQISLKPEVWFSYVQEVKDVMDTINYVENNIQYENNRVFFVFKKGNKQFGRDHIYQIVMKHKKMVRKAPMLASLSDEYSVF